MFTSPVSRSVRREVAEAPAYTTICGILRQLDPASVEAAFRRHAAVLNDATNGEGQRHVAIDGKLCDEASPRS